MKEKNYWILLLTSILILLCCKSSYTQDSISTKLSLKEEQFAEYLYDLELYELSAHEYEKLLYTYGYKDAYLRKLIQSYRQSGQGKLLIKRMRTFDIKNPQMLREYISTLTSMGLYGTASNALEDAQSQLSPSIYNLLLYQLYIVESKWEKAREQYALLAVEHKEVYKNINQKIIALPYKSRFLAGALSSIVPGAGRIYVKDYKDALFSVIFIGGTGFQSYRRFKSTGVKSVGAWVYGGLSFGFYLGNIYGSVKAAKRYNSKLDQNLQYEALRTVNSSLHNQFDNRSK